MTDIMRALNPTAPITNEAEAKAAARASAIAIFLGVIWGLVGFAYLMTAGQATVDAAVAQAALGNPQAEAITRMAMIWVPLIMVVIQLVLGLLQWAKPGVVIPIIFAILVAFGLVSGLLGLMMAGQQPEAAQTPLWQIVIGFIIMVIQLVLHITGIRGARKLDQLRFEAAQTY